jgi:hypothetical protein
MIEENNNQDGEQDENMVPDQETEPSQEEIIMFEGKKKFEVKMRPAKGGGIEKAIFIDGEILDWQVDLNSFVEAVKMGPMYMREIQKDIEKHFIESVSDFVGRKVTADDIKKAIKDGYI